MLMPGYSQQSIKSNQSNSHTKPKIRKLDIETNEREEKERRNNGAVFIVGHCLFVAMWDFIE